MFTKVIIDEIIRVWFTPFGCVINHQHVVQQAIICPRGIRKYLNKFNYRFDSAPNFKAKIIRYFLYTFLVFLATFSFVYLVHYMGGVLGVDVNKPLREIPTHVVILGLLGMLFATVLIYSIVLWVAKSIFTKFRL